MRYVETDRTATFGLRTAEQNVEGAPTCPAFPELL